MVDKLLLSRSGKYSVRVQVPLPLHSLNFNIFELNLSELFKGIKKNSKYK